MSKELIEAANNLLSDCDCKGHDVRLLCGYILDTVREDDDEPLSIEWLKTKSSLRINKGYWWQPRDRRPWYESGCITFVFDKEVATSWQVDGDDLPRMLTPKTRGQFRTLCRLLGVTLPEGGAA